MTFAIVFAATASPAGLRPQGSRFSFRGANSTSTLARQLNVTSPTAANIAAVFAGFPASFLTDLRKRGVKPAAVAKASKVIGAR